MKKIFFVLLAQLALAFVAMTAHAIDFKISGSWIMSFGYGQNGTFEGKYNGHSQTGWGDGQDNFEANQRLRLKLEAVASESLSGTIHLEIGETTWGQAATGGALGADSNAAVELMGAYLNWAIPDTNITTSMGIQGIMTPAMASGNAALNDQAAAIVVSGQVNEQIAVTGFWARPYNDNYPGYVPSGSSVLRRAGFLDNIDAFGLMVPITADGLSLTPWGMYAVIGPNAFRAQGGNETFPFTNLVQGNVGVGGSYYMAGMLPVGGARHEDFSSANTGANGKKLASYGNAWWGGLTGSVSSFDPFNFSFDFEYGSVQFDDDARLARQGWFASLLLEYNLNWGVPGIYAWYGSGDDSNPANGSERFPALDPNNANNYSYFAFDGAPYIERCAVIGNNMAGTWGIGARLNNFSFIDSLSHIIRINYIRGTNSPSMAKKMSLAGLWANGSFLSPSSLGSGGDLGMPALYLTSEDSALELGSTNSYQIYENMVISLEADYVALWLNTSNSVWGARQRNNQPIPETKDAWNVNLTFAYSF